MTTRRFTSARIQSGFTLLELLISLLITVIVLAGVVQVLVVSKSNFVTARELAVAQENARYAMKFIADEIKMAGFTGCSSTPLFVANSVNGSTGNWYLDGTGLQGYEYDAGINTFPTEFRADVAANTDALVIRRIENTGLRVVDYVLNSARIDLNKAHSYKPGQVMLVATPDCQQLGIFQITNPTNNANNATHMVHNTGNSVAPGNCTKDLIGSFSCANLAGVLTSPLYADGSSVGELRSEAYYIGVSGGDVSVPALYRERMLLNTSTNAIYTAGEELVKGVENIQILYGLDNLGDDGVADLYAKANSASMNWDNVVSIRLSIRMRSLLPVYNKPVDFGEFEGTAGTDGSDRFMRQDISTTLAIRNS